MAPPLRSTHHTQTTEMGTRLPLRSLGRERELCGEGPKHVLSWLHLDLPVGEAPSEGKYGSPAELFSIPQRSIPKFCKEPPARGGGGGGGGGGAHPHLIIAPPDRQLKHESLNGLEVQIDSGQAGGDDHIPGGLGSHEWVAVPITAHPAAKGEEVVVQREVGLPDLGQRGVDAAVECGQAIKDGLLEI